MISFFKKAYLSCTSMQFYRHVIHAPVSYAWKYFFALHAWVSIVLASVATLFIAAFHLGPFVHTMIEIFPEDLTVRISSGALSINKTFPYTVLLPTEWQVEKGPKNLVVFDTEETMQGAHDFMRYNSLAVVTEHAVYMRDDTSMQSVSVFLFPDSPEEVVVNRTQIESVASIILRYPFVQYRMYAPLLGVFIFLGSFIGMVLYRLFFVFIATCIMWVLLLFFRRGECSFGTVFRVSIFALTLMLVINVVGIALGLSFLRGWVYHLAYLAWISFIFSSLPNTGTMRTSPVHHVMPAPTTKKKALRKPAAKKRTKKKS